MRPLKVCFVFLLFQAFFLPRVDAAYLSWSGSGRLEAFYQNEDNHYGSLFFAVQPKLHISDSFSFQARFDILGLDKSSPWESLLGNSGLFHQRGYVFLYKDFQSFSAEVFPFILPTQFYIDYKSEFLKIRIGRAPYHFGLGASYFASENPFDLWMSRPDQMSVYMVYESFYLQPSFFYDSSSSQKTVSALLQGGLEQESWKAALLYEHKFKEEADSFVELYGEYEEKSWSLKSSLSYLFRSENSFALALEGIYNWPSQSSLDLELKAGALNQSAQFHPQYQLSLLLQNRWMREGLKAGEPAYHIAASQIQNSIYMAPSLSLSFFEESLKLQPLFLLAYSFEEEQSSYEGNISAKYKRKDSFFFNFQAGLLYQKKWEFGLLAQAAVSF